MYRKIFILYLLVNCCFVSGCSSGLYVKLQSTAPDTGPVLMGMKRIEAERYLGVPMFTEFAGEGKYRCIYEYETVPSGLDTLSTDILDVVTLGLGNLIVGPVDRFKKGRHLISIVYEMKDDSYLNDMVTDINGKNIIAKK